MSEDISKKDFSKLLIDLENVTSQQKSLWREIYENALTDRANGKIMFDKLVELCDSKSAELSVHGPTIAKYMERMSKANDQLLKLSELVAEAKEASELVDSDTAYDQIEKGSRKKS